MTPARGFKVFCKLKNLQSVRKSPSSVAGFSLEKPTTPTDKNVAEMRFPISTVCRDVLFVFVVVRRCRRRPSSSSVVGRRRVIKVATHPPGLPWMEEILHTFKTSTFAQALKFED